MQYDWVFCTGMPQPGIHTVGKRGSWFVGKEPASVTNLKVSTSGQIVQCPVITVEVDEGYPGQMEDQKRLVTLVQIRHHPD